MGLLSFLIPGGGRRSSANTTSTATTMQDNRVVADGSTVLQAGARLVASTDASDRSYTDASDRSTSNITLNNADASRIAEFNAGLLRDVSLNNTDAVKAIAGFGRASIERMGESVTDLYKVAGSNNARAWEHTLQESRGLLTGIADAAARSTQTAQTLGQAAFQPTENKGADAMKYAALAGVAVVAVMLLRAK